ncbi:MAG: hypothetical protein QW284_00015 [Ignisphaera sp.]
MEIGLYRYRLELLTPAIVTSAQGYRGMSYTTVSKYILGSVVRGALFSQLLSENAITSADAHRESLNPSHSVTPALHVPREKADTAIPIKDVAFAHALTFMFKHATGSPRVLSFGIDRLLQYIETGKYGVEEALKELIFNVTLITDVKAFKNAVSNPIEVLKSSTEMKSACGNTIVRDAGGWVVSEPSTSIYVETAVDRARRSAASGALYAYEYIEPGNMFVGLIATQSGSPIADALKSYDKSCLVVRVGRGGGRGFGISRLCIESIDQSKVIDPFDLDNKLYVLYAASPMLNIDGVPGPVVTGDEITVKVFGSTAAVIKIRAVIGRHTTKYYGWSYRTGLPKLPVEVNSPGTLAVAEILRVYNHELLAYTVATGFNSLSSQGFNFAKLIRQDFVEVV